MPAKFYTISEEHVQSTKYHELPKLDTYGSERSWEPVESVTTIRGDCRVRMEALTDKARSKTGSTDNIATEEESALKLGSRRVGQRPVGLPCQWELWRSKLIETLHRTNLTRKLFGYFLQKER